MRILALEPYYGGSHRAFLDGWIARSRHDWTLLTLPDTKWKWRMRHAAITFAAEVERAAPDAPTPQLVFCSDILNLAEFGGLAPRAVRKLPAVLYFHENQLTYPVREESERDYHFMFSNLTSALAARRVWFNSAYHRDAFLDAAQIFLRRMPDHQPLHAIARIREKSEVRSPPIGAIPIRRGPRPPGPPRILWAARWEYDKAPERFFGVLEQLKRNGVPFHLSVLGGTGGRRPPEVFARARRLLRDEIRHWGYIDDRAEYERVLQTADIAVSTADHEFFGLSLLEAAAAGAFPLVPRRLAYPEVFGPSEVQGRLSFFYDGSPEDLCRRLCDAAGRIAKGNLWESDPERGRRCALRYTWDRTLPDWDDELDALAAAG